MTESLTKTYTPPVTPSGPYKVYVPGSPGIPPTPAYCIDVYTYSPSETVHCLLYDVPSNPSLCLVPIITYGSDTRNPNPTHECYPYNPGSPGVPAQNNTYPGNPWEPANYHQGWNSSARSYLTKSGDFAYYFQATNNMVGVIVGVGRTFGLNDPAEVQFGYSFANGMVSIYEGGSTVGAPFAYGPGDFFDVQRQGVYISYWQNGTQLHISTKPTAGTMMAICWLYYGNDEVDTSFFGGPYSPLDLTQLGLGPTVNGILFKSMPNYASDIDFVDVQASLFPALIPDTTDNPMGFEPGLNSWLSPIPFLNPIIGQDSTPSVDTVYDYLPQIQGWSVGIADDNGPISFAGVLKPHDDPYIGPQVSKPLLFGESGGNFASAYSGGVEGFLPAQMFVVAQQLNTYVVNTLFKTLGGDRGDDLGFQYTLNNLNNPYGTYPMYAFGHQNTLVSYGFDYTLQNPYVIVGKAGGQFRFTYDGFTLGASGTVTNLGAASILWPNDAPTSPNYLLMAHGLAQDMGRAYLQYGSILSIGGNYDVYAQSGIRGNLLYSGDWVVTGHGLQGNVGDATLALGQWDYGLISSGHTYGMATLNGILPQLVTYPAGWQANITGPKFTIVAHGTMPVASTEGYSMTLLGDNQKMEVATTHYTSFPFTRIVRFGNTYYGMSASGLYALGGNTFGANPIYASIQTGETDLGHPTLKRPRRLYMRGRLSADLVVGVYASEVSTNTYMYDPNMPEGGAFSWRVPLGRGIKAQYLSYIIKNSDGGDFEIQEIGPEVDVLRRTA